MQLSSHDLLLIEREVKRRKIWKWIRWPIGALLMLGIIYNTINSPCPNPGSAGLIIVVWGLILRWGVSPELLEILQRIKADEEKSKIDT
ncbi:MAG: hypothetical protein HQK76_15470 [Desulfobacterales bacterium]|nr:hypothetical protein [Desulfobacterales bacterium]